MTKASTAVRVKRKFKKNIIVGVAHVNATFNNTIIAITDMNGNVVSWSSSGSCGFKGSRKSTPYASQVAAESASKKAQEHGLTTISIKVKGTGREAALRALQTSGFVVTSIDDITSIPHNGCRPRKRRRV